MKPYKGKVKIICTLKENCIRNIKENVRADCIKCPKMHIQILDLNNEILAEKGADIKTKPKKTITKKTKKKE